MDKLKNHPTVLLIDDDEAILEVLGFLLQRRQFHVLTAHSAMEAINVWTQNLGNISAVISDKWLSPVESTCSLLKAFQQDLPGMPIILMSGDPSEADEESPKCVGLKYLAKPFNSAQFYHTLDALIGC